MATTEAHLKQQLASELAQLKSDVQALKSKFYDRQANRGKLCDAQAVLQELGDSADLANPLQQDALHSLQQIVASELLDPACTLPIAADALHKKILASNQSAAYRSCLRALHHPCLSRLVALLVQPTEGDIDGSAPAPLTARLLDLNGNRLLVITGLNRQALSDYASVPDPLVDFSGLNQLETAVLQQQQQSHSQEDTPQVKRQRTDSQQGDDLAQLLQFKSVKERDRQEKGEELLELLDRKTAREQEKLQRYQTGGAAVREYCPYLTKEACREARGKPHACQKLHQRKILYPWTDESLGNCNYLDTCRDVRRCRYVHYELDPEPDEPAAGGPGSQGVGAGGLAVPSYLQALPDPQWINCDIRNFDFSILGKFGVIMTDPPWEIHQDLPYGTMSDQELLNMGVAHLQDDGVIFMWVTGRALELGRELLSTWGYRRVDELIWVKTNSLQRLIRTGRTGHWLNHSKEHCLVGYKGNPHINRFVDCDVLVSEVRETSRKPDEMYPLLERLSPGTRKLEIFARRHNVRPGWVSLGNQLDGTWITDPELLQRYIGRYGPPVRPRKPPPRMTAAELHMPSYGGD